MLPIPKSSLAAIPGLTDISLDPNGLISVTINGQLLLGRTGYAIEQVVVPPLGIRRVEFVSVGDINGDGSPDYELDFIGQVQQLFLLP